MAEHDLDTPVGTPAEEAPEPSLRDTLDAAFEATPSEDVSETESAAAQRARDELGRFAPGKAPEKATGSVQELRPQATRTPGTTQGAGAPQAQPVDKAPASWTPAAREKWGTLDPVTRAEIHRRESEMGRVLQESAGQRQFMDAFQSMTQPYEVFFRQEGVNPLQAMDHLMRAAAELRVGTPGSKAALVANLIDQHGIDIGMLDTLLANRVGISQVQQQHAQAQQQYRDPRVDQLLALQQQQHAQAEAQTQQEIRTALNGFAQAHEFYRDVAGLMADLADVRVARGEPIDMERLYAQACQMHEGVSQVMAQRAATRTTPPHRQQAVLRARRAAVSVAGDSTPTGGATMPEDDSIRSLLSAAMDQQAR
jgi:hypothetical protein